MAPTRSIGLGLALAGFLTVVLAAAAFALDFPALTGRVVDQANILDASTRAALTTKLADLEAKSTDQLVVVTLRSLQGTSIEDYGVQLGRQWQIGQRGKNNGVLLIVAPNEHKVRIEVGYGLEGTLTDAITRLIIENSITPRFRANDYPGGVTRGVDDIIQVLTGDAEEWKQRAAQRVDPPSDWSKLIPLILLLIIFGVIFFFIIKSSSGSKGSRGGGGSWLGSGSSGSGWSSGSGGGFSGGGFSGGGGSFGGGGSSGSW